ncbi:uncharacterized protein LOC123892118 [Trifolium pratense]|uniref:uncharacterized protein LOC123892118 n=1 Tax=Trifolium pratense TaxID=57577 RepID=UPI001E695A7F|nr:uncharacterized protein LOC123892118 [Trifolium pratense]
MTLSIECKVIRKKRSTGGRKPKSFFQKIPSELQSNIFERLCRKDQSRAMCVAHSWRECILNTTLSREETPQSLARLLEKPPPDLNLHKIFHWCSQVMCCMVGRKELIDTCNGLLLFCHNRGQAQNITHDIDHYYVLNHATKQCVVVSKPVQTSGRYSYATLIYDPAKSWYFKIMHFQGHRYVNIFSSENGVWTTLSLSLPESFIASCWIKKSVYLNGSVYRLTDSCHLIKIRVDPQENVSEQAEIIPLTPDILSDNISHWELSVKGGKLFFVIMSTDVNLKVYELVECTTRNVTSYSWYNVHRIETRSLFPLTSVNLSLFHPYYEVAFFKRQENLLCYFNLSNYFNIPIIKEVPYHDDLYGYLSWCHPALLQSFKPFICCLNKEKSRVFQRLSGYPLHSDMVDDVGSAVSSN